MLLQVQRCQGGVDTKYRPRCKLGLRQDGLSQNGYGWSYPTQGDLYTQNFRMRVGGWSKMTYAMGGRIRFVDVFLFRIRFFETE